MWVFGYGSLMWDGWETQYGCTQRVLANLPGYSRMFNKASIKNWGTKETPGPTLNLSVLPASTCQGVAFEFPDSEKEQIFSYLKKREGKEFPLHEIYVYLEGKSEKSAFVSLYTGLNVIKEKSLDDIAAMVLAASGTNGTCFDYVKGIAKQLSDLKINDPVVTELWLKLNAVVSLSCKPIS